MKILIYSDVHWNTYSSILRQFGKKYSVYLEGLVDSLNWTFNLSKEKNCDAIVFAGDFFDKPDVTAQELSALNEVKWNTDVPNYFLCGNHEMASMSHDFSALKLFCLLSNSIIIDKPEILRINDFSEIAFLPYILESNRKDISEYFGKPFMNSRRLLISHNDIKGIQMGNFISKGGFSIEEIESICDKCINGHIHNGSQVSDKIFNVGSLSAINFSNDSSKYNYGIYIFDTDSFSIDVFENPVGFNFYKLDATAKNIKLTRLKNNSVVSLKCKNSDSIKYKDLIKNNSNIIESRVIVEFNRSASDDINKSKELAVDHLVEFRNFILENLGSNDVVLDELEKVCK